MKKLLNTTISTLLMAYSFSASAYYVELGANHNNNKVKWENKRYEYRSNIQSSTDNLGIGVYFANVKPSGPIQEAGYMSRISSVGLGLSQNDSETKFDSGFGANKYKIEGEQLSGNVRLVFNRFIVIPAYSSGKTEPDGGGSEHKNKTISLGLGSYFGKNHSIVGTISSVKLDWEPDSDQKITSLGADYKDVEQLRNGLAMAFGGGISIGAGSFKDFTGDYSAGVSNINGFFSLYPMDKLGIDFAMNTQALVKIDKK